MTGFHSQEIIHLIKVRILPIFGNKYSCFRQSRQLIRVINILSDSLPPHKIRSGWRPKSFF